MYYITNNVKLITFNASITYYIINSWLDYHSKIVMIVHLKQLLYYTIKITQHLYEIPIWRKYIHYEMLTKLRIPYKCKCVT